MDIAFSGTRRGMTDPQKERFRQLLRELDADVLHNGAARGADVDAAKIANELKYTVIAHPASNVLERDKGRIEAAEWRSPRPPIERNHRMVDESDMLIATPSGTAEQFRGSGTWATIRHARRRGTRLVVIWPNGKLSHEFPGL